MKKLLATGLLLAVLALPTAAQRSKRQSSKAKADETGPVSVTRSASLRIAIASDTVGIFDYLSDSQKLTRWFPDQAVIEPQLGGKYHFRWKDADGVWSGVVTEFIRGNTLGLTWLPPGEPYETNVRFKLSPQGAQTMVELTHSGFTSSEALDKAVKAWAFYLQNLKSVIEEGSDMRPQIRHGISRPATRSRRKR